MSIESWRSVPDEAADEHIQPDRLAAYVDGALSKDDAELVEAHLDGCPMCTEDAADLRAVAPAIVRARAGSGRRRTLSAGAAVAAAAVMAFVLWPRSPQPGEPARIAEASIEGLSDAEAAAVREAVRAQRVTIDAAAASLTARRGTLLGGPAAAAFEPLSPVATVVLEDRPTFQWSPHPGARSYGVSVSDETFSELQLGGPEVKTTWTATSPLTRGRTYRWQVTASTPDGDVIAPAPPAPEARFRVLEAERAKRLTELAAKSTPPLALGILFAEAGVLDRAERYLAEAAQAPGDAAVANALRAQVAAARGDITTPRP